MEKIYGRKSVLETLNSDLKVKRAYILDSSKNNPTGIVEEIIEKLDEKGIETSYERKSFFDKLQANHQGVLLEVESYSYKSLEDVLDKKKLIILDQVEDPHNLGAIIRTAEAFSFDAVIIPERRSVKVNATVYKTSAGAINNIDVVLVKNTTRAIKDLKKENFWIYGLCGQAESDLENADLKGKIALVIGNEGDGISRLVKENCDVLVKIPMMGKINSLNASVAAAISMYEVSRQNGFE